MRLATLSALREDVREADFVCSTDDVDSYGEVVRQVWRLERFLKNPVALWSHDARSLPVGQWKNVRVEAGALKGTVVIASAAANPLAENVWQSIREKTLRAVSVGFVPHKVSKEEIDGVERYVLDDNELYEISLTPVPANPEALVDLKAKAAADFIARKAGTGATGAAAELSVVPFEATTPVDSGAWDSGNALKRVRKWASSDGSGKVDHIDWAKYKQAFAWYDPKKAHEVGGYKLPHHDVRSGKLVVVRAGVIAAGNAMMGSRGGVKIPDSELAGVKSHLAKHYKQFDLTPPWEAENKEAPKAPSAPKGPEKTMTTTTRKKDDEEEMDSVTCPECGADFEPKKAKKAIADLHEKHLDAEARAKAAEDKAKDLEAKNAALVTERNAAQDTVKSLGAKTTELSSKLIELELAPLVGTKIAPAEKDGLVEVAKLYMAQPDGEAKWKAHVAGINARPDMKLLGNSVLPNDTTPRELSAPSDDDAAAEVQRLANDFR